MAHLRMVKSEAEVSVMRQACEIAMAGIRVSAGAIKPGITCLWQVMGRNTLPFDRWMELDKEYVENWSIWLDCKILLKTIPVVITGHGAS